MKSFISIEDAINIIKDNVYQLKETEEIEIINSIGRVTAEDYFSDMDIPPFNKAAMDGYAIKDQTYKYYKIVDLIKAGDRKDINIKKNECIEIMTGSEVPLQCFKIVPYENTVKEKDLIKIINMPSSNNICKKGEDVKKGEIVIPQNTIINSFTVGMLASVGIEKIKVYKKLNISVIATGDELVLINEKPLQGKIRDCNSYSLYSIINSIPFCNALEKKRIDDKIENLISEIDNFTNREEDIMLITGGASKGKYDFSYQALKECGFTIFFDSIKIQPGKPTIFAKKNNKFIFSLPGNPVSALICFEIFVKEAIYKLQNIEYIPKIFYAKLKFLYERKKTERTLFIPVKIENINKEIYCTPVKYNGSADIFAYKNVNHIMKIDEGIDKIEKGESVLLREIV